MIFCPKIIECQPYPAGKKQKHGHDDIPNSRDVFFEYIHDRQDGTYNTDNPNNCSHNLRISYVINKLAVF